MPTIVKGVSQSTLTHTKTVVPLKVRRPRALNLRRNPKRPGWDRRRRKKRKKRRKRRRSLQSPLAPIS
jgi:hypothetical protein